MSTNSLPEHNFPSILPEVQSPDAEALKRTAAKDKLAQYCGEIATIPASGQVTLKIQIVSAADYERSETLLSVVKDYRRQLDDAFEPEKTRRYRYHREITQELASAHEPAAKVETALIEARGKWRREMEQARIREQKRLQEESERQAREEARKAEEEARLQHAIEAEEQGDKKLAEQILTAPTEQNLAVYVPPVVLPSYVPQSSMTNLRQAWKGKLKGVTEQEQAASFELLVKAVAADLAKPPAERAGLICLLELNDTELNKKASSLKSQLVIPGCESYPVETEAAKGRRR